MSRSSIVAAAAALAVSAAVLADVTVRRQPGPWTRDAIDYPTEKACTDAAEADLRARLVTDDIQPCTQFDRTYVTADCANEPRPAFTSELFVHACPNEPEKSYTTETRQVAVSWVAGCWSVETVIVADECAVKVTPP